MLEEMPNNFPVQSLAYRLNERESKFGIRLSGYGYIQFLLAQVGTRVLYPGVIVKDTWLDKFLDASREVRDTYPALVVNAGLYFDRLNAVRDDMEATLDRLVTMSHPHVLYIMLAGAGLHDQAARYYKDAEEVAHRYPSAFDRLIDPYKSEGERLVAKWQF